MNIKNWMKNHLNLLEDYNPHHPENILVINIAYAKSDIGVHSLCISY